MSAPCPCAACNALRQLSNTASSSSTTPGSYAISRASTAGTPPYGNSISSIASTPALLEQPGTFIGILFDSQIPAPHAQVKWNATPEALIVPRKRRKIDQGLDHLKPTTFPKFSILPAELRIRIWALSAHNPRVIELRTWKPSQELCPLRISAGSHSVPSLLHANRESRLEGLRIYHLEEIGVSIWKEFDPLLTYIPWRYHPDNPFADKDYQVFRERSYTWSTYLWRARTPSEPVQPYAPQRIYISYSHDTIYLGPDFSSKYLLDFLSSPFPNQELPGLQDLAIDRKIWLHETDASGISLRKALLALKTRPVKEVYIVPDDERGYLEDRWYYGKHDIRFLEPLFQYRFKPAGEAAPSNTVAQNLSEWFERLWKDSPSISQVSMSRRGIENSSKPGNPAPKVSFKTIRRSGRIMSTFQNGSWSTYKDGVWEIQKSLGDMQTWKTWISNPRVPVLDV